MKQRVLTNEQKGLIVLGGLKGQPVEEICSEHGISRAQYYKWRDQLLTNADRAFESDRAASGYLKVAAENQKLKATIKKLRLELKKIGL